MFPNCDFKAGGGLGSSPLPHATKTSLTFKDWPLHPVLFGALYVLVSFWQIYPFSSTGELAKYLLPTVAILAIVQYAFRRGRWKNNKPAILSSLLIVNVCFFGDLRMQLEKLLLDTRFVELARLRYLLVALTLFFIAVCWKIIRFRGTFQIWNRYLNVLSAAMIVGTVAQIFMTPPVPTVNFPERANTPLHLPKNPPDVYYIITDAYTSGESLKKFWNYDNSPFLDFLKQSGFRVVENAHGNSDFTPRCLATYLNMDYAPRLPAGFSIAARVKNLCNVIEHAEAPARFKASGYKMTALSLFAACGEPRFYFFPIIGQTTFGEFLFNKTMLGYLNNYRKREGFAETNLKIFATLSKIAREKSDQPKFVYAHLIMPHEPFFFDRHGNRVARGMNVGTVRKEDYLEQLIYENTLLTNAVSEILKNSKTPPIIIIQGDHGFRHLPTEYRLEESTTILNALHLPGAQDDWIHEGMTPVNTFRMIFNRYFGENYEYRPDTQQLYFAEHE